MHSEFGALVDSTLRRETPAGREQRGAGISDEFGEQQLMQRLEEDLVSLNAALYADFGREIDTKSSAGLRRFIKQNPMVAPPTVGVESNGQLVATWRIGAEALSLQFLDRLHFSFAVTLAGKNGLERSWGHGYALTFFDEQPAAKRFAEQ